MCKRLYPNIEAERVRAGLTREEIAAHLGVTRKTFYNWVSQGRIPQCKLEAMSELFGVTADYLLGRAGND